MTPFYSGLRGNLMVTYLFPQRPMKRKSAEEPENMCELKPRKMSRNVLRQPCVVHNFNSAIRTIEESDSNMGRNAKVPDRFRVLWLATKNSIEERKNAGRQLILLSQDLQENKSLPSKDLQENKSLLSKDLKENKSLPSKDLKENKSVIIQIQLIYHTIED
uniref:Uncharacterized protein n=1 Tax=Timema monikensis TaxID=170555 RepID=A0A7R9HUR6_9NEOP|nr:unnamed protein product [Timema monikensis]